MVGERVMSVHMRQLENNKKSDDDDEGTEKKAPRKRRGRPGVRIDALEIAPVQTESTNCGNRGPSVNWTEISGENAPIRRRIPKTDFE